MASRACSCCAKNPSMAKDCLSKRCKDSGNYDPEDEKKISKAKRKSMCQGRCGRDGWDYESCSVVYPEHCKDRKVA